MHLLKTTALLVLSFFFLQSCRENTPAQTKSATVVDAEITPPNDFVAAIEKAHNASALREKGFISFDLKLTFGGSERFNGRITSSMDSGKIKAKRYSDGTALLWQNDTLTVLPDTATWKNGRFAVFTWQYFFMAPYKLSDPGTQYAMTGEKTISGTTYDTAKLTFEKGTGDAPDDWYLLYKDPATDLLRGMAYIVTAGGSTVAEAEENAHAIYYDTFQTLADGTPVATKWSFYNWNEEEGFNGDPIGSAVISNVNSNGDF